MLLLGQQGEMSVWPASSGLMQQPLVAETLKLSPTVGAALNWAAAKTVAADGGCVNPLASAYTYATPC